MIRPVAIAALTIATATACATSGAPDPVTNRTVAVAEGHLIQTNKDASSEHEFDAAATAVWPALARAYKALGIDVVVNDPSVHRMGNTNFHANGRFNGQALSVYADCGNGPTGPRANSSRIYFSVITTVEAIDATHTRLRTDVRPVAVDMTGTTNARLDCGTTGEMEAELYDGVQQALRSSTR
jgi:hypothetical protein